MLAMTIMIHAFIYSLTKGKEKKAQELIGESPLTNVSNIIHSNQSI